MGREVRSGLRHKHECSVQVVGIHMEKINAKTTHSEDVNIANLLSISPLLK